MSAGPTFERVYDALKWKILEHEFLPGTRLDPAHLATELLSSATPIRDALHLLTGEGLVDARTSDGFHLPAVAEPDLKDLYQWNAQVLTLATRTMRRPPGSAFQLSVTGSLARRTASVFAAIARLSANREHLRAVQNISDRLHAARTVEPIAIASGADDLKGLEAALGANDPASLRREINAYHRRRVRASAEILWHLYRSVGTH